MKHLASTSHSQQHNCWMCWMELRPYKIGLCVTRNCSHDWPCAKIVFFVKYFSSAAFSSRGFSTNAILLLSQGRRGRWVRSAGYLLSVAEWVSTAAVHGGDITGTAVAARFACFPVRAHMAHVVLGGHKAANWGCERISTPCCQDGLPVSKSLMLQLSFWRVQRVDIW